jgi:hypothetical protein
MFQYPLQLQEGRKGQPRAQTPRDVGLGADPRWAGAVARGQSVDAASGRACLSGRLVVPF